LHRRWICWAGCAITWRRRTPTCFGSWCWACAGADERRGGCGLRRRARGALGRPGRPAQRLPASAAGHSGRQPGVGHPQATGGQLLPGVAAGAAPAGERALVAVVAECYMRGVSTRRVGGWWRPLASRACPSSRSPSSPGPSTSREVRREGSTPQRSRLAHPLRI
jgi:hypothetical protein